MLPLELETLRKYLANIPFINSGGCGIAALAMLKYGQKLNIYGAIMALYDEDNDLMHMVYLISNLHVDTIAIQCPINLWPIHRVVSEEEAISMVENNNIWNPVFNREKYIPKIEQHLGFQLISKRPESDIVDMKRVLSEVGYLADYFDLE